MSSSDDAIEVINIDSASSDSSEPDEEIVPGNEPEVESRQSRILSRPPSSGHPRHRPGKEPMVSTSANGPYKGPPPRNNSQNNPFINILAEWREDHEFSVPVMNEYFQSHYPYTQEPPYLTTPVLVAHGAQQDARLSNHDNKLEELETQIIKIEQVFHSLATMDTCEMMDQSINTVYFQVGSLRETIVDLKIQAREDARWRQDMRRTVEGLQLELDLVTNTMKQYLEAVEKRNSDPKGKGH